MLTKSLPAILFILSLSASAHCPSSFKSEKVCLMLDQNVIFIYDEKMEHNGPYKDLTATSIESVKAEGIDLKFSRVARGVYRINYSKPLKAVDLLMMTNKGKSKVESHLKLKIEN